MPTDSNAVTGPRTIKASEFKAKCLKLMDEVAESGEEIIITKNGRPVSAAAAVPGKNEDGFRPQSRQYPNPGRYRGADARRVVRGSGRFRGGAVLMFLDWHVY